MTSTSTQLPAEPADYDKLVDMFNQALIHTLRKHSVAGSFLDPWVPNSDPVVGILNMINSARFAGLKSLSIKVSNKTLPATTTRRYKKFTCKGFAPRPGCKRRRPFTWSSKAVLT